MTDFVRINRARARRALDRARLRNLLEYPDPSGEQLRRIAELAEVEFDLDAARPWYAKAAMKGDPDSIAVVVALGEPLDADTLITEVRTLWTRLAAHHPSAPEEKS